MDPRIIVTKGAPAPTAEQVKVLGRLLGKDVVALHVYSNLDTSVEGAIPTGITLTVKGDAPVDPTLLSDRLFELMTLSPASGPGTSVIRVNSKVDRDEGPSLGAIGADLKETRVWENELGGPGAFVGAYSSLREDHATHDHMLVARGTAPQLIQDLKRRVPVGTLYNDLVTGSKWVNARYMVGRNVKRNVAQAAASAGLAIDRCLDMGASVAHPSHAPPEVARPAHIQATYSVSKDAAGNVVLCNGVSQANVGDQVLVAGPTNLFLFDVTRMGTMVPATTTATTLADKRFKQTMKELGCKNGRLLVQRAVQQY